MSKFLLLIPVLFGQALSACAQVPRLHPFALGIEGVAYKWASGPAQAGFQMISGAVFRYAPQRLGVRGGVALSHHAAANNLENCADCLTGQTSYRTGTIRAGGQYNVLPNVPWLYSFLDVAYRNTSADGRYTGGLCGCLDNTVIQTTHSAGAMVGVGASFQILPHILLGPEIYYEGFVGRTTTSTTDNRFGQQTTQSKQATEHAPAVRIQAAIAF